jgi:type 2 lantibiotic biosynthesis protein LanM
MKEHHHILTSLASKALSLGDRITLSKGLVEYRNTKPEGNIWDDELIKQWVKISANGDFNKFQRRLIWQGIENDFALNKILAPPNEAELAPYINWTERFSLLLDYFHDKNDVSVDFDTLVNAIAEFAFENFCKKITQCEHLLNVDVKKTIQNTLYDRIQFFSTSAKSEFSKSEYTVQSQYQLLLHFAQAFPVWAKIIVIHISQWEEFFIAFCENLLSDFKEIEDTFSNGKNLGKVAELKTSISDFHNNGKSVIALAFENRTKIIYKPKNLKIEADYQKLLSKLKEEINYLDFKTTKLICKQNHGWVEFIEHRECKDENQVRDFYKRAGMLLSLLHILKVTDCHMENLIAHGEYYVFIDTETLFHPDVNPITKFEENTDAGDEVGKMLINSVLRTGLLPRWNFRSNEKIAVDISALGGYAEGNFNPEEFVNVYNLPRLQNNIISPLNYVDEICEGFSKIYDFFNENRDKIIKESSEFNELFNNEVRFIFRPTRIYSVILKNSFNAWSLRNGLHRSLTIDYLSRAFLTQATKPNIWKLLDIERANLENLDIPFFEVSPRSDSLYIEGEAIDNYFNGSSWQNVINQLSTLSDEDKSFQIELIKGSLYSRISTKATPTADVNSIQVGELTIDEAVEEAERIAQQIIHRVIYGKDGSCKWIGFGYFFDTQRFQLMPLRDDLYSGSGGIALFLAALDFHKNQKTHYEVVYGSILSNLHFIENLTQESIRRFTWKGIGIGTGIASNLYYLVKISDYYQEPKFLEWAERLSEVIDSELIKNDTNFDIVNGSAGCILGLLTLYDKTDNKMALEKAIVCGEHLLNKRTITKSGLKTWTSSDVCLAGFSHGASGICYALYRLYQATQNANYLDAANEAIDYENMLYFDDKLNWLDLRTSNQSTNVLNFNRSWCHGTPGIVLSRLNCSNINYNELFIKDLNENISLLKNGVFEEGDSICCGNFGLADILISAAHKSDINFLDAAKEIINKRYVLSKENGYSYEFIPNSVFNPSLFQGLSGIGYTYLRLANKNLGSILSFE